MFISHLILRLLQDDNDSASSIPEDDEDGDDKDNDDDDDDKKEKEDKDTNPPLFLPILRKLNSAHHKPIGYLITTLVQTLTPDPSSHGDGKQEGDEEDDKKEEEEGSERRNEVSEKGLRSAEYLLDLCERLRLSRAARIVRESLRYVT
jgi:hypothetical protein